ncbi:MAG: 3-hydroxyacyl-CoA dehydrogenase NAD-binding domain-containing protein, partial [Pseudomonadota bacterium]
MTKDIQTVSVIGAGQMGSGIAHVFALADFDVRLFDIDVDALSKAVGTIEINLGRAVARGKITESDQARALKNIMPVNSLADSGAVDLVIEAATEKERIKQAIFEDILPHVNDDTILTSNTSSISITRLASRTDRPERFMGLHFMNPVPIMQLVELIRGIATDEETFRSVARVVDRIGKTSSTAEDFPAFIVNR